jgi:hypothetical protein
MMRFSAGVGKVDQGQSRRKRAAGKILQPGLADERSYSKILPFTHFIPFPEDAAPPPDTDG